MNELSEGSEDENSGSEGTSSDQEENDDEIDDGDMVDCEQVRAIISGVLISHLVFVKNGSEAKDNRYDEKVAADDAEL